MARQIEREHSVLLGEHRHLRRHDEESHVQP
jgi:hypothetical protein